MDVKTNKRKDLEDEKEYQLDTIFDQYTYFL